MKKTLVALAVTAFAASASAVTIYDSEGTKVDFGGSLRLFLDKTSTKHNQDATIRSHSGVQNNGSRFNITVKHNLGDDLYALGHYETRFNGAGRSQSGWGAINSARAYVGLGDSVQRVTFGRQLLIADDIGQAGYDYYADVGSANIGINGRGFGILTTDHDSALRYEYSANGLTVGANYNFANGNTRSRLGQEKAGYGVGLIYTQPLAEGEFVRFAAGYTHDDFVGTDTNKANKDGLYAGLKYRVGQAELSVDGGRGIEQYATSNKKTKLNFVRTGGRYNVSPQVSVYGNYSYGTVKAGAAANGATKDTAHQFMLGSDYRLHKQVLTFVEGRVIKQKDNAGAKQTDKLIGVGMRVFW